MLKVGMQHDASFVFTVEQVANYCQLAGDRNAIHHDVDAARLRFPEVNDIIVPGGLVQIAIMGMFGTVFPGDGSLGLTFAPERMRKPVCPGEVINVRIELTRMRGELAEFSTTIRDAGGSQISSAKSRVIVPSQTYYEWWSARAAG